MHALKWLVHSTGLYEDDAAEPATTTEGAEDCPDAAAEKQRGAKRQKQAL